MRLLISLSVVGFAALLVPYEPFAESNSARQLTQKATSIKTGLILQQAEGERRVRRPRPSSATPLAAPSLVIKVDDRNGGSPNFFVGYEEIAPGSAIPPHFHPEYDEVIIVHEGKGLATLGVQERVVTAGATIYIPPKTRVSLKNTGTQTLSIFFIFPQPGMVSDYYRGMTVADGERVTPFSAEELAAFRARHKGHIVFDER